MSIDRETLKSERRAALAAITAHRFALRMDDLDPNYFDDIIFSVTDLITSLRIYTDSVEVNFADALQRSESTTRSLYKGDI